jgi:hypothetical protein
MVGNNPVRFWDYLGLIDCDALKEKIENVENMLKREVEESLAGAGFGKEEIDSIIAAIDGAGKLNSATIAGLELTNRSIAALKGVGIVGASITTGANLGEIAAAVGNGRLRDAIEPSKNLGMAAAVYVGGRYVKSQVAKGGVTGVAKFAGRNVNPILAFGSLGIFITEAGANTYIDLKDSKSQKVYDEKMKRNRQEAGARLQEWNNQYAAECCEK